MKPALLSLALLSACTALVPSTVAQLAATDPAQMDPGVIAVAVVMPAGLRPQPLSTVLVLEAVRSDTGETAIYKAALDERPVTIDGVALLPGEAAYLYQIAERDLAPMRAVQATVLAWDKAAPDATQGRLSVGLGACTVGAGPVPEAEGAVFIRLDEDGPMLPLIPRSSIAGLIGAEALASIRPCNAAQ
jgi:hypothetical protein